MPNIPINKFLSYILATLRELALHQFGAFGRRQGAPCLRFLVGGQCSERLNEFSARRIAAQARISDAEYSIDELLGVLLCFFAVVSHASRLP